MTQRYERTDLPEQYLVTLWFGSLSLLLIPLSISAVFAAVQVH